MSPRNGLVLFDIDGSLLSASSRLLASGPDALLDDCSDAEAALRALLNGAAA